MRLKALLRRCAGLGTASLVVAQEKCGSGQPGPEAYEAAVALRAAQRAEGLSPLFLHKRAEGLLVSTYLHVVEDEAHRGFVTDTMISDQVRRRPNPRTS